MNTYEIGALISFILALLGVLSAFFIFPTIWVYKDAKERGLKPVLWTVVVLLLQTLGGCLGIGYVLYLIIRFVVPKVKCPSCQAHIEQNVKYCSSCGQEIDPSQIQKFSHKHNKWLWGIVGGVAAIIVAAVLFMVSTYNSIPMNMENVSVGKIENTWNDVWTVTAKKSTEKLSKTIRFYEQDHGTLIVEGDCTSGTLTLNVIGNNKTDTFVLSDTDDEITVDLNEYTGSSVELMLVNDNVEQLDFKADWSK